MKLINPPQRLHDVLATVGRQLIQERGRAHLDDELSTSHIDNSRLPAEFLADNISPTTEETGGIDSLPRSVLVQPAIHEITE